MKSNCLLLTTLIVTIAFNLSTAQDCPPINAMKDATCMIVEYASQEEADLAVAHPAETVIVSDAEGSNGLYIAQMMGEGSNVIFSRAGVCGYDNYNSSVVGTFQFTHSGLTCTYGTSGQLLPVEFSYFNGNHSNNKVLLEWGTATEVENDGFYIERSADGKNFEDLGFVVGEGNTTEKINYAFSDRAPLSGVNYYRLRQMDFNGASNYSSTIIVEVREERDVKVNYDFASEELILTADEELSKIEIYDMTGNRLLELNQQFNVGENRINVRSFSAGNYVIIASDSKGNASTDRFVKI